MKLKNVVIGMGLFAAGAAASKCMGHCRALMSKQSSDQAEVCQSVENSAMEGQ